MPIFEYSCEKCGEKFEKLVKNQEVKVACEKCGSKKVTKLFSSFAAAVKEGPSGSCSVSDCGSCCPTGSCCPSGTCNL